MEIKPGKFVVLTYDLYAGAGEPEETLMMRATDEMPDQFVFGVLPMPYLVDEAIGFPILLLTAPDRDNILLPPFESILTLERKS